MKVRIGTPLASPLPSSDISNIAPDIIPAQKFISEYLQGLDGVGEEIEKTLSYFFQIRITLNESRILYRKFIFDLELPILKRDELGELVTQMVKALYQAGIRVKAVEIQNEECESSL